MSAPLRSRLRRALLAATWTATLGGLLWLLHQLGNGPLATPPLLDPTQLETWLAQRDAATVAFVLVRLVALVLGWYLMAATVLGGLARASRRPQLVRLADLVTLPPVRRMLGTAAGVGLTSGAAALAAVPLFGGTGAGPARSSGAAVTLERLPDGSLVELRRLPDDGPEPDTATMRVDNGPDATMRVDDRPDATMRVEGDPERRPATWTVGPGDSFWSVADAVLAQRWGRPPTDDQLTPYWRILIEANRFRLVEPENPDLLYDGQQLDLPPTPPAPV